MICISEVSVQPRPFGRSRNAPMTKGLAPTPSDETERLVDDNGMNVPPSPSMLAIWHDVAQGEGEEFENWHSTQHLPERVTIPGISLARRYKRLGQKGEEFCSILNLQDIGVLGSDEYLRRLNAPTPWTIKVSAGYMNFYRCALTPKHSKLTGRAPYLVSIRVDLAQQDVNDDVMTAIWEIIRPWAESQFVFSLSVGPVQAAATSTKTSETSARFRTGESLTDLVIFAEVSDLNAAQELQGPAASKIEAHFNGAQVLSACYQLRFEIDSNIAAPVYARNLQDHTQYPGGRQ